MKFKTNPKNFKRKKHINKKKFLFKIKTVINEFNNIYLEIDMINFIKKCYPPLYINIFNVDQEVK